jgi:cysteine synthase A
MIHDSPLSCLFEDVFVSLKGFAGPARVLVKLEGFHITGSIKIKAAKALIDYAEEHEGANPASTTIIESSSGNMGVAMACVCAVRRYRFVCVTDPNITASNRRAIEAYGGEVVVVRDRDGNGGYVGTRIAEIRRRMTADSSILWLNQYAHPANKAAHARTTAPSICKLVPEMTWFFAGVGTSGTFSGCSEYFRQRSIGTNIVAVDALGSTTFGGAPGIRLIPGIGNSRPPELADARLADRIVLIDELDSIRMCRRVVQEYGLLLGGSSGSVLTAVVNMAQHFSPEDTIVAIAPDFGEKYLDTIYNDEWVRSNFPAYFMSLVPALP